MPSPFHSPFTATPTPLPASSSSMTRVSSNISPSVSMPPITRHISMVTCGNGGRLSGITVATAPSPSPVAAVASGSCVDWQSGGALWEGELGRSVKDDKATYYGQLTTINNKERQVLIYRSIQSSGPFKGLYTLLP